MGVWLTTRHSALVPHEPSQGSLHFLFIHAKCEGHSLLLIHSGLQYGGEPRNSGRHEHVGVSPATRHSAFAPQGDGTQGFVCRTGSGANRKKRIVVKSLELNKRRYECFDRNVRIKILDETLKQKIYKTKDLLNSNGIFHKLMKSIFNKPIAETHCIMKLEI